MATETKTTVIILGAYVGSLVVAVVSLGITAIIVQPHSCADASRLLTMLWVALGVMYLVSAAAVAGVLWRTGLRTRVRVTALLAYGAVLLITYLAVAFILMIAFNC